MQITLEKEDEGCLAQPPSQMMPLGCREHRMERIQVYPVAVMVMSKLKLVIPVTLDKTETVSLT
jgi:hypothetical protein